MTKYKSHKAALLGTIWELKNRGYEPTKSVVEMSPDECEKFILDAFDGAIYQKDCQIVSLKAKVEKYESLKNTKEPERPKFVSPSQTHKTFWSKLKYILFE
jgi:hypothetical protein